MSKTGGTAGNNIAPRYVDGAMFANDAELYLYGSVESVLLTFSMILMFPVVSFA